MSEFAIQRMTEQMTLASFETNDVICKQGTHSDSLYFLGFGRLQITVVNHNGHEQQIGVLCPGSIFGEMLFMEEGLCAASIVALGPASCYVLARNCLIRLQQTHLDSCRELYFAMLMNLAKQVRTLNRTSAVFREL